MRVGTSYLSVTIDTGFKIRQLGRILKMQKQSFTNIEQIVILFVHLTYFFDATNFLVINPEPQLKSKMV